ncbi:hypothetical protein D9611_012832 [Ephemerocybe angulata]|uniref:Uncharacterized protein n=1 Tax=Ephemerocybe angulata TaxID=980116 RepID=A0A8H5F181_9AGAR|nr:hypothetical protein D9611_012832 [Tulosesus angulatus]
MSPSSSAARHSHHSRSGSSRPRSRSPARGRRSSPVRGSDRRDATRRSPGRRASSRAPSLPPSSDDIHSSPARSSDSGSPGDRVAVDRRLWEEIVAEKAKAVVAGKKRGRNDTEAEDDDKPTKPVTAKQMGRGICKIIDLWKQVSTLMTEHDIFEEATSDMSPEDVGEYKDRFPDRARAYDSIRLLPQIVPNLWAIVDDAGADLSTGAKAARSDDVGRLRPAVAGWLSTWSGPKPVPALQLGTRADRGIQHDVCGRLLCPIRYDWDDPTVRASIRAFKPGFELGWSARCLYEDYRGNPSDIEEGYLKSPLLVKTFKHIFTSPSSAEADSSSSGSSDTENSPPANRQRTSTLGRKPTKRDIATTLNMGQKVTSRSIAYAAVQLLFALSSAPQWKTSHEGLNFNHIYYRIVDYFDVDPELDPESFEIVKDLLDWWNESIFPGSGPSGTVGVEKDDDDLAQLRAARRRRVLASKNT